MYIATPTYMIDNLQSELNVCRITAKSIQDFVLGVAEWHEGLNIY